MFGSSLGRMMDLAYWKFCSVRHSKDLRWLVMTVFYYSHSSSMCEVRYIAMEGWFMRAPVCVKCEEIFYLIKTCVVSK